jgi:ribonucleoside-diphosphate reductase beta chain
MSEIKEHVRKIINTNIIDQTKEPLFFGQAMGFQRYDNPKYKKIDEAYENQMLLFWRPNEIDLTKDRSDFKTLTEQEKFIFTKNLGYQILLDSIQSRGILHLLKDCSNLEVESFCETWAFFELIHSRSYTHIIKNVYTNPSKIFDEIANDEEIIKRASSVTKYYDDLINEIGDETLHDKKKKLYLTLVSIQILEFVRFYVSFACSYYFAEQGKMIGNASIIKLINRDENLHGGFTRLLIKTLSEREDEGFQDVIKECEPLVMKMWEDAANEEIEWAKYLFKDGDIFGLNADILSEYMKYLTNLRMKNLGLKKIFPNTKNPITWINKYVDSSSIQVAPQETEITSYLTSSLDANVGDLSDMDLDLD